MTNNTTTINYALKRIADEAFVFVDEILEIIAVEVSRNIPRLRSWLFIQNQRRVHGFDVEQFCGATREGGGRF